jgi:D-methionine transport system ATP-binding protein
MIQIKQLNKIYISPKQRVEALQDIDLEVNPGEIFGVIGKSGAGKSTLIRCVNLLEKPTNGQIIIDNVDLTALPLANLRQERRQIGMIFQLFNLLESRTVYENIAFPLELAGYKKKNIKDKILPLLKLVNLEDRKDYYPSKLSGGQKQRVAIARALVTDPKLLLCDEATSALDPESTASILKLLKNINRKLDLTILLITHEMDVIKSICDRVAILDHGRLIEQGNVIDIFTEPKSEITKRLTQSVLHLELPDYLTKKLQSKYKEGLNPIIRLAFIGASAKEPIVTALLQRFNVTANILQADLESIHDAAIGFMVCELIGEKEKTDQALQYLQSLKIKTEVIGYA